MWPGLPRRFKYLAPAMAIYGRGFRSSAEVDERAARSDPGFVILAAAYNEARRRGHKPALTKWIRAQRWPWSRRVTAERLYWLLTTFSCKGVQELPPFSSFEVCMVNERSPLDPSRIPDSLAFLREHVPRWGFLIDQNEAGAFAARATPEEREDLRRIIVRFNEPAIDDAMAAWHRSPDLPDERWWVERMLSVADDMGLRS